MPNPGFELINTTIGKPAFWQPAYYILFPLDSNCTWVGVDSMSFPTNDAHSGNYALELRTATYCQSNTVGGNIRTMLYDVDTFADQRIPFAKRPAQFSFYYKLFSVMADRGYAEVSIEDSTGNVVADAGVNYYQAATWTQATIPLTYHTTDTPAYLTIKFRLYNDSGLHYGTRFLIDDIDLEGITGVNDIPSPALLSCYPVPATSALYLRTPENMNGPCRISITDAMGRLVQVRKLTATANTELKLDVESLPPGVYFVKLNSGSASASGKFVK